MKRIIQSLIIPALFIAGIGTVAAQSHYYHLEGDTVRGRCPIYYYSWWPNINADGVVLDSMLSYDGTFYPKCMRHIADSTLKIVGIASTLTYTHIVTGVEGMDPDSVPILYYVLYNATPNGPVELIRVYPAPDYNTHPKRYMELPCTLPRDIYNIDIEDFCDNLVPSTYIAPLREYYFNTPIIVTDSFYLGVYHASRLDDNEELSSYYMNRMLRNTRLYLADLITPIPCELFFPRQLYLDRQYMTHNFYRKSERAYSLVFPIIEVDTVGLPYDTAFFACDAAIKLQYVQLLETAIRITWNDTEHSEWEISVVAAGGDPDTGRITHATTPQALYYGLSTDTAYDIYIRTHCRFGWSDWSYSLRYTPQGYHPDGIETASPVDFSLMPNPAKGEVAIEAPSPLQGTAEIIDLQGKTLMTVPLSGSRTMLDVSSLSAGNYLVHVSTAQGSSTKKLSLQ